MSETNTSVATSSRPPFYFWPGVLLITLAGVIPRVWALGSASLWLDEIYTEFWMRGSFRECIELILEIGNQTPVLAAIGAQTGSEGLNLNFTVSATDLDQTTPFLTTTALPAGATFTDNSDGTGVFDWTPTFTDAGAYDVTFYASDGVDTAQELVTITIGESGNQLPVIAPIAPPTIFSKNPT